MMRILNIRLVVYCEDGKDERDLRKKIKKFIADYPIPLCYSIKSDSIQPSKIKDKNGQSNQNSNPQNKMADL
jgi:hypothetical protein